MKKPGIVPRFLLFSEKYNKINILFYDKKVLDNFSKSWYKYCHTG